MLDLHVLQSNLNGFVYYNNVLNAHTVPRFYTHSLADTSMDENTRQHTFHIVREYWQYEAIDAFQWHAMSHDMNPIEHVWDLFSRIVNQRNPHCQNITGLTNAILEEWRRFLQERLRRLIREMNRRVRKLWHKRGGYTRY